MPFARAGSRLRARSVYTHATNVRIRLAATGGFLAVVAASLLKFSYDSYAGQSIARRTSHNAGADRDHHAQEPNAEPGRAAFHRARSRGREADGEEKTIDAMSAYGPF